MEYLIENKEWIFGGIGVAAISGAITGVVYLIFGRGRGASVITQKSGKNSVNIQSHGDVNIKNQEKKDHD